MVEPAPYTGSMQESSPNTRPSVRYSEHLNSDIAEEFDWHWSSKLYNPLTSPTATEDLQQKRREWDSSSEIPTTVVFTAGVFDVMHLDHVAYLLHTKACGAQRHYETYYAEGNGQEWDDLNLGQKKDYWQQFVYGQELRQVVSVDGNEYVAARKGFNPEKGNSIRPIYDWETRARTIASVILPGSFQSAIPVVDAVTIHDPVALAGTAHGSIYDTADVVRPHVWTLFEEAQDDIAAIPNDARFDQTSLIVIPQNDNYFNDRLLNGKFSTSKIVKRILGDL